MVTLTQCDLKRSVQLNPQTQMYILNSWEQDTNSSVSTNGNTTTTVKKGGGGFGGFGSVLGKVVGQTGIGQTGNQVGNIAGQVATQSITMATANIKPKDELTLEIKLQNGVAVALNKQFKQKAKSNGEDIISPLIEQAANAIVTAVGK